MVPTLTTDTLELLKPILLYDSRERFFAQGVNGEVDSIYGRLAKEGEDVWAQYWFWYTRDWSPLPWRKGHEGDWEMVQFLVTPDGQSAGTAAYSQHSSGEFRSEWISHPKGLRPLVYVALGRHANYSWFGWYFRSLIDFDRANGKGREVEPTLLLAPEDGWASWPRWGRDDHSPSSPGFTRKWRHPSSWALSLTKRTVEGDK